MTKIPKKGAVREPVSLYNAKTNLSSLVDLAASGKEFVITKSGKPYALLAPLPVPPAPRTPGKGRGLWNVKASFDKPLPDEILAQFAEDGE
jgi:antitoxin (DNA-binding transcriptional repressor) of toxin-antitoxin stability system